MSEAPKISSTQHRELTPVETIVQLVIFLYLIFGLAAFLVAPILATRFMDLPYIGGFIEQTMVFNGRGVVEMFEYRTGNPVTFPINTQLVNVGAHLVPNVYILENVLSTYKIGEDISLVFKPQDGVNTLIRIELIRFPDEMRIQYFYLPYFIGIIFLISALWIFFLRRQEASGRSYTLLATSIAILTAASFDVFTSHRLVLLWVFSLGLVAAEFINFALSFPRNDPWLVRQPSLRYFSYGIALILTINSFLKVYDFDNPYAYISGIRYQAYYLGFAFLFMMILFGLRRTRLVSPTEREQIWLILLSSLISFGPPLLYLGSYFIRYSTTFSPYILLTLIIFPASVTVSFQRYRLLYTDFVMSRSALYGFMAILISIGYALLVAGLSLILLNVIPQQNPILTGLILFVLAITFQPIRQTLFNVTDALFFRGDRAYQDRLQNFSNELTRMVSLTEVVKAIRQNIERSMYPSILHIFIYDAINERYIAAPDNQGTPTSQVVFASNNSLVTSLATSHAPFFIPDDGSLPPSLQSEKGRIILLGAHVYIPLPGKDRLTGWIAMGNRPSGEAYTPRDIKFLSALCDQAALAIERAQVVSNMEQRVRALNILGRVSQGINITIELDDILELIYAQTIQIVPADDFHILLLDDTKENLIELFCVKENDRLTQLENLPAASSQTLDMEVCRSQRVIVTNDYVRECRSRGLVSAEKDLLAWMGIPMNAGADTIGVLVLGSRDINITYTQDQANLVTAISDQGAGAIVKTRLFLETQQRARQLASLNEISRQLTSTLELEPLLQNILHSAVEILNCEAGSLLMLDEQTEELVFRVTAGPVARNLLGRRIPPGIGIAGKTLKERQSIVVNDVRKIPEWFSKPDEETGFVTKAVLVVPLQLMDKVIGVIEVINKKDSSPFSKEDNDLLNAFSAQAAVAIENARLYTLTDQALAARVEELSVLQRIGRELNTSLDINRAMNITLEWSLRQSGLPAGLAGTIEENGLHITASEGYGDEIDVFPDKMISLDQFNLQEVIENGIPQRRILTENHTSILRGARSQVIVPIRRETQTIGILMLENTSPVNIPEDTLNFLLRLSDQSSIALSNAQLYAAVQAANQAKSEFVSFVAHELKNPMTSIKGYTELIAAGAVGQVSEAQGNFLNTIRSNVERMATLISDLADLSRIEANRLKLDFNAQSSKDILDETIRSLKRQIDDKGQEIAMQVPADLPAVWADRTRFAQVLINLVSNACKYTPNKGKISIGAEVSDNLWNHQGAPKVVHFWVADTGIGISSEDQKKIFQKFFRSEDPKTREVTGTGLGLNITKSLIEMQGGNIWFESEFRKGTIFHFTMPVAA